MAPSKSAKIEIKPMHIPPRIAAVGMYLFRIDIMELYCWPFIVIP